MDKRLLTMLNSGGTLASVMVCIALLSLFPVAGYLAIVILLSRFIRKNHIELLYNSFRKDRGLVFLFFSFGLSALFTKQHLASLTGATIFVLQVSLFIIIRSSITERWHNFAIIKYILIASIFVSILGIFQYYFISYMHPGWLDRTLYHIEKRAFSTLYNPNVLGSYLIIIISLAVAGFPVSPKKSVNRFLTILTLVTASFCMVLTSSRGSWLGLAASILVILFFSRKKRYILSMLAIALLLAVPQYETIVSRINLDFLSDDSSLNYRWHIWKYAIDTFLANPLFGGGIGSFGFFVPSHFQAPGYLVSHAHNIYLHLLAETGILGFVAFLGYILGAIYISYKIARHSQFVHTRRLALGATASIVGLLVHGIVDATLWLPQLTIFVWIMMAVIRNLGDLEGISSQNRPATPLTYKTYSHS